MAHTVQLLKHNMYCPISNYTVLLIMVIELSGVQFGLKSYA